MLACTHAPMLLPTAVPGQAADPWVWPLPAHTTSNNFPLTRIASHNQQCVACFFRCFDKPTGSSRTSRCCNLNSINPFCLRGNLCCQPLAQTQSHTCRNIQSPWLCVSSSTPCECLSDSKMNSTPPPITERVAAESLCLKVEEAGDIMWARVQGYPWWPVRRLCIVARWQQPHTPTSGTTHAPGHRAPASCTWQRRPQKGPGHARHVFRRSRGRLGHGHRAARLA